jgi:hypothetical protein
MGPQLILHSIRLCTNLHFFHPTIDIYVHLLCTRLSSKAQNKNPHILLLLAVKDEPLSLYLSLSLSKAGTRDLLIGDCCKDAILFPLFEPGKRDFRIGDCCKDEPLSLSVALQAGARDFRIGDDCCNDELRNVLVVCSMW